MTIVFSNPPRKGQPARIWHLDCVLQLARHLPVFQKQLVDMTALDDVAWFGTEYHYGRLTVREIAEHCRRIQNASFEHPVILSSEGWVMDGFHRLARAHLDGLTSIAAVQFVEDPPPNRISSWHDWHEATLRD